MTKNRNSILDAEAVREARDICCYSPAAPCDLRAYATAILAEVRKRVETLHLCPPTVFRAAVLALLDGGTDG